MALTLRQIEDVCLVDQDSDQCRYLGEDPTGKFYCIKCTPARKEMDEIVREFKNKYAKKGVPAHSVGVPLGDNCKGYTFFRYKKQGYDIPGS